MKALETGNLNYVLIWIPSESEKELQRVFEKTLRARKAGKDAQEQMTVLRLHLPAGKEHYMGKFRKEDHAKRRFRETGTVFLKTVEEETVVSHVWEIKSMM
jgi:hypothetical protein